MTKVISIVSNSSEVGKTTLAINLAAAFHLRNKRVLLIDNSSYDYNIKPENWDITSPLTQFCICSLKFCENLKHVEILKSPFDIVIIDGMPTSKGYFYQAISDYVLVPVFPSTFSVENLTPLMESFVSNSTKSNIAIVFNKGTKGKDIPGETFALAKQYGRPIFNAILNKHPELQSTLLKSKHIFSDGESIPGHEINSITEELIARMG